MTKCNRTVCQNEGVLRHTQNNALYCVRCARRINEANPGLVEWPSEEELKRRKAMLTWREMAAKIGGIKEEHLDQPAMIQDMNTGDFVGFAKISEVDDDCDVRFGFPVLVLGNEDLPPLQK